MRALLKRVKRCDWWSLALAWQGCSFGLVALSDLLEHWTRDLLRQCFVCQTVSRPQISIFKCLRKKAKRKKRRTVVVG